MGDLAQQLALELRALARDKAVLVTIVGGIVFYALLYPQPYLNDRPVEQTVAVVDLDRTAKSRQLTRWADATQGVRIRQRVNDLATAKRMLVAGEVRGILLIPYGFERDLALGHSPQVSMAGDANYFLVYGTVVEGLVGAVTGIGAEHRIVQHLLDGMPLRQAAADWTPLKLNARPLFNLSMGYLGYVVPAVFVLILQQTMLLAGGLIGAASNEVSETVTGTRIVARFLALFCVYVLLAIFYMGVCFELYDIARSAALADLFQMIIAFVAASAALAVFLGVAFRKRELVAPVVMASSLPLVFTAGFVWPLESVPWVIQSVSQLAPTTSAIQGFLKLNQMGAEFRQVAGHVVSLLVLCAGYIGAALLLNSYRRRSTMVMRPTG